VIDYFRSNIYKYIQIVNRVVPPIDELRAGLTFGEGSSELEPLLGPVIQSHQMTS
jgi:hypothetical protein